MNFIYFIILIGVLIFFHELGHFLAAKAFGVKVLKFALGFGKSLVSFRRGETEYSINWFPLGGYVKMAGQEPAELRPEDAEEDDEPERAFDRKPRWQRLIIILAGPVFNLILPLPIYFLFLASEATLPAATIGSVIPGSPAATAGVEPGDEVLAIDGEQVRYWEDLEELVSERPGEPLQFELLRRDQRLSTQIVPAATRIPNRIEALSREVGRIGVTRAFLAAQVGVLGPNTVAARAGLQSWDLVVEAGGQPVSKWVELQRAAAGHAGQTLPLKVRRADPQAPLPEDYESLRSRGELLSLELPVPPAGTLQAAGLEPAEFFVLRLEEGGAADKAGLQPGDRIVSVDGEQCANWHICFRHFQEAPEQEHTVTFIRPGPRPQQNQVSFAPEIEKKLNDVKQEEIHARVGLFNRSILLPAERVPNEDRWRRAMVGAVEQNWEMIRLNVLGLGLLATRQISADTVGGPIMIYDLATKAAERGWEDFLWLLAIISINLGLINLLPIPILDGGQIVFLGIEAVMRGPMSLKARVIAAYVGLTLIVALMIFAFKNDIERYWDDIARFF